MKIIPGKEIEYKEWFDKNDDAYSRRCFTYAEQWAELLEAKIADGDPAAAIEQHADSASHEADTDGITGFMYGAAVSILAQTWIHGEALRRWHNLKTQIGKEGEKANAEGKTLNPALLSIG